MRWSRRSTGPATGWALPRSRKTLTATFINVTLACGNCCRTKMERAPRLVVKNGGSPRCARRASIDHQLDGVDVGGVI